MVSRVAGIALLYVLLVVCACSGANALRCDITGEDAPTEVTLMASPTAPKTDAIVISPDCTYVTRKLDKNGFLSNNGIAIDRIASVPTETKTLGVEYDSNWKKKGTQNLASGLNLGNASNLIAVQLSGVSATALQNSTFPPFLEYMSIVDNALDTLANVTFPDTVNELEFHMTNLASLSNLPRNITKLSLNQNDFATIDFAYPSTIETLDFSYNERIENLGPAKLPPRLMNFTCDRCSVKTVRGIAWPATLKAVWIQLSSFTEVEIRESDWVVLGSLQDTPFSDVMTETTCSDNTAKKRVMWDSTLCVITDDHFVSLYGPPFVAEADSEPGTSVPSSSPPSEGRTSRPSRTSSTQSPQSDGSRSPSSTSPSPSVSEQPVDEPEIMQPPTSDRSAIDDVPTAGAAVTKSSPVSSTVVAIAVLFSVVVTASLATIGYRVFIVRRRDGTSKHDKDYRGVMSPSHSTSSGYAFGDSAQDEYLEHDIRNDPTILRCRLDMAAVQVREVMELTTSYVTRCGLYKSKRVALKRLSTEAVALDGDALVARFMDDIRMSSTLEHPKIVAFVGVMWSCRQDITLVSEYLDGGDLHSLLHQQSGAASSHDWYQPWIPNRTIKSKGLIARDVVEAVVYLHSFSASILHHDVKARNVLLDTEGNAKLSNVGISRELSVETTMTGEVGAVAWIAPEVLRGERYSVKADIYSLGVLLVEMDRCGRPYGEESMPSDARRGGLTNTQIAVAVVAGKLRPSVRQDSPDRLKDLVAKCVSFDAAERPTAMEVHFALRQMLEAAAKP